MVSPSSLIAGAVWISLGIVALLWATLCGATASWAEKQGVDFRKAMLISLFLTPIAGMIFVRSSRAAQTRRALA